MRGLSSIACVCLIYVLTLVECASERHSGYSGTPQERVLFEKNSLGMGLLGRGSFAVNISCVDY